MYFQAVKSLSAVSSFRGFLTGALLSGTLMALIGCDYGSSADSMLAEMNSSNIRRVANLYSMYQFRHDWRGPKDEAALMAFIQEQDADRLKKIGIDKSKLDDLFVSERDEQPFQIRWGVNTQARAPSDPVVFEAEGRGGVREVAFTGGEVVEADSEQYDLLWQGETEGSTGTQRPDGGGGRRR
jgi:hypothetical protein